MAETPTQSTPSQKDIRNLQKQQLKDKVVGCLSRFKFTDLICVTILSVLELEPSDINDKLDELKLPFNKKSVVELLSCRLKGFNLGELKAIDQQLQLYCNAFYSNRRVWKTLNLLEPEDDFSIETDLERVRRNILQAFRIKGFNAVVEAVLHEDLVWLIVVEKKLTRKKGIKLQKPINLCYEIGTPFLFVASPVPERIMQCILRALHYKKFKTIQLAGKNIKSLLSLLKNKDANSQNAQQVEYNPESCKIGSRDVDFTKMKARETYADEIFKTKDPVLLETFTVNAEAVWKDDDFPALKGKVIRTKMQIKSKNLVNTIKYMIAHDMVPNPLPEYMKKILSGKNKIDMRDPQIKQQE